MYVEGSVKTFTANGDIGAKIRVKLTAASATSPPQVEVAGAGEQHIGITEYAAADTTLVAVRLRTAPGTHEGVAADTFAVGAVLYGAAAGKLSDTSSGTAIGIAIEACTGAGDIVEFIDFTVISTTAATVSVADANGNMTGVTVEAVLDEIMKALKTSQAIMPVPLTSITQEDGTPLVKQATTVAGFSQLADKEVVINIPVDCSAGESLQATIPVPQDLNDAADVLVHVLAGKAADLDVLTLDCEVYPCAAGDTGNEDIQDTAAQTITEAASELVFTCGNDGVLAAPGTMTIVLALGGTNDGDAVYIYGVWLEYTRKALTT